MGESTSTAGNAYSGIVGVMVAGEGVEGSQLLPASAQLLRGVTKEPTDVCSDLRREPPHSTL